MDTTKNIWLQGTQAASMAWSSNCYMLWQLCTHSSLKRLLEWDSSLFRIQSATCSCVAMLRSASCVQ